MYRSSTLVLFPVTVGVPALLHTRVAFNRVGVAAAPRSYGGPRLVTGASPTFVVEQDVAGALLTAQLHFDAASAGRSGIGMWSTKFCSKCCPNSTNTGVLPFRAAMKPVYPDAGNATWACASTTRITGSTVNIQWRLPLGAQFSSANLSGAWLSYAWEDYLPRLCPRRPRGTAAGATAGTVTPVEESV
jgi:hypothetical protein